MLKILGDESLLVLFFCLPIFIKIDTSLKGTVKAANLQGQRVIVQFHFEEMAV